MKSERHSFWQPSDIYLADAAESANLALAVHDHFVEQTESFAVDDIGSNLAYLTAAILRDEEGGFTVHAGDMAQQRFAAILKLLPDTHPVHKYVRYEE